VARGSLVAGARIRVRDAEWVVGHVERNPVSGAVIHATGLSGIVRDKPAIFVQTVERQRGRGIEVVDPADVELVADSSGGYEDTLLHLEAAFRKSAPTGPAPQVAGKAAIDDLDFQLDPVRLALRAPRVRILLGDDVGLGKTLEAGLLASELILARNARRLHFFEAGSGFNAQPAPATTNFRSNCPTRASSSDSDRLALVRLSRSGGP
jgi:hypothetical protein